MRTQRSFLLALLFSIAALGGHATAQTYSVLYSFASGSDIEEPFYGMAFDASGNLYGSSQFGGAYGKGGVFELSRNGTGWTETVIHSFTGSSSDGAIPYAQPVVDSTGNVYVSTLQGGKSAACIGGCGVVAKFTQTSPGAWMETILHAFGGRANGQDGAHPLAIGLNPSELPFGVTSGGGTSGVGTLYQIVPSTLGGFKEIRLYDFANSGVFDQTGGLAMDQQANLYGTSLGGGNYGRGAVFEMSRNSDGTWTEQTIYSFNTDGANGEAPYLQANLTIDAGGNLYGTCRYGGVQKYQCGSVGCGFVYKLTKSSDGTWQEHTLHKFQAWSDGESPEDGVIVDAAGIVYGTTLYGGGSGGQNCDAGTNQLFCGTAYKLTPQADGSYAETILHSFAAGTDGAEPAGRLVLDSAGNLYGTTIRGGDPNCGFGYGCGVVFKITP